MNERHYKVLWSWLTIKLKLSHFQADRICSAVKLLFNNEHFQYNQTSLQLNKESHQLNKESE